MNACARAVVVVGASLTLAACGSEPPEALPPSPGIDVAARLQKYTPVRLTADLSALSDEERRMIPLLIDAAREMDDVFWRQAYGDRDSLLAAAGDEAVERYLRINYGPWDRLEGNEPFLPDAGPKPPGSGFYPPDITAEELERAAAAAPDGGAALKSQYTLVRRDGAGGLVAVPYHEAFAEQHGRAAALLREAAALAPQQSLRRYLELRADALLTGSYQPSDLAWMDMKDNRIELVLGPIETYEDLLFGYKASHEAYVLVKDLEWSGRLERYAGLLPRLQRNLPVEDRYKAETPGTESDLGAYDAVYYAGEANAGSKTIAINLPNDEEVQLRKGTRRLQLKNAMQAKFDEIMVPIAAQLIAPDQRQHVTFDAFFGNTMFHEVAHGLGIKNTVTGAGTVREALKDEASPLEEGKADVLGLFLVGQLIELGELEGGDLRDHMVTFLAGIFRSVRFGATSAHGLANMARFDFFEELGAFSRDPASGTYRVDFERMQVAVDSLSGVILRFQGNGDYAGVQAFMAQRGQVPPELQADLDRLAGAGIPVDIVFEQGEEVLGLPPRGEGGR